MAAMPAAQSGLLANALKFTGELSCEPLAGDVTVTTGVVAKAVTLSVDNPEISRRGSQNCGYFMINLATQRLGRRDVEALCKCGVLSNHRVDP
jgi:hypothetical protein